MTGSNARENKQEKALGKPGLSMSYTEDIVYRNQFHEVTYN